MKREVILLNLFSPPRSLDSLFIWWVEKVFTLEFEITEFREEQSSHPRDASMVDKNVKCDSTKMFFFSVEWLAPVIFIECQPAIL